jgi:LysM repeat protein
MTSNEPVRSSPLVTLLLGLALLATLFAFAAAAGFVGLPGGGIANGPTATPGLTLSPTTVPSESASPTLEPTATPTLEPTPVPTPSVEPTLATGEVLHTVQTGETLSSIGLLYDVPWPDIAARNGLQDPFVIVPGQVLIIPIPGSATPSPTGSAGPTPAATAFTYVVQSGDTLSGIAKKFDVTQQAILDANPQITDPNKIFPGDEITIPAAP